MENSEELHVIPASYQIEDALELSGTKVLMKAGKKMPAVKQFLKEKICRAVMVENCGMDTEQKYFSAEEIPDQASYYSLIIVKEKRKKLMVHFNGAGPGAPDLITVRGQKLLGEADIIIYAGSLVNPALLDLKKEGCVVYNSATMTLEQVIDVMKEAESKGQTVARLHTGDPCLYGAIREQTVRVSALSAERLLPLKWNIRCRISPRVLSSPEWPEEHRFRSGRALRLLRHIRQRWLYS